MDDYAREVFRRHPAVRLIWNDSQDEYYRMLARCDIVYNVRLDANDSKYRSLVFPNKVLDALAVGRPVLVARENHVARWVMENRLGFSCSCQDTKSMYEIIAGAKARRMSLPEWGQRNRALFLTQFEWGVMEKRLLAMYADLQGNADRSKC
jgi:glycosyltransferase involved in cell wall biosynthesis